uniref:Uncharacterized protein n=1 Tax=Lygus hesperus TaxID=30085 RepID=A0A0A9X7Q1_LYGHE
MDSALQAVHRNPYNWAIIEVKSLSKDVFDVIIHVNNSALPSLNGHLDLTYGGQPANGRSDLYIISGFLTLQYMIEEYYLQYITGNNTTTQLTAASTSFVSPILPPNKSSNAHVA